MRPGLLLLQLFHRAVLPPASAAAQMDCERYYASGGWVNEWWVGLTADRLWPNPRLIGNSAIGLVA